MGEPISLSLNFELNWESTRRQLIHALLTIGKSSGDDPQLMIAKAECALGLMRQMIEQVPPVECKLDFSDDTPSWDIDEAKLRMKAALDHAVESTLAHCVQAVMNSLYDLCTSQLSTRARSRLDS